MCCFLCFAAFQEIASADSCHGSRSKRSTYRHHWPTAGASRTPVRAPITKQGRSVMHHEWSGSRCWVKMKEKKRTRKKIKSSLEFSLPQTQCSVIEGNFSQDCACAGMRRRNTLVTHLSNYMHSGFHWHYTLMSAKFLILFKRLKFHECAS